MLRTEGPRERILLMGGWGVGKSTAATTIARYAASTKSDARLYVLDTTYEAERNFMDNPGNVEIATVETWDDYMKSIKAFRAKAKPTDWLVVDRIDMVWDQAQQGYSEKAFGKEIQDWFVEYRKDHTSGHAFSGDYGVNWVTIKRMHSAFMTEVMRFPGNVLVCAKSENVVQPNRDGKGGDSPEVRAEFGRFGVRPAGEKNLGFMFHTVLLLSSPKQGEWVFTTIRDRMREQVKAKPMKDFVSSYLIGVAGWKL